MVVESNKSEKPLINFPKNNHTKYYYRDVFLASYEINKFLMKLLIDPSQHLCEGFPKYFLVGSNKLSFPSFGNYNPETDLYGPGIYAYALTEGYHDTIGALTHGVKNKVEQANEFVFLFEVLNSNQVFGKNVTTLCSDWAPYGSKKCRSVSTNGSLYVFHPRIARPEKGLEEVEEINRCANNVILDQKPLSKLTLIKNLISKSEKNNSDLKMKRGLYKIVSEKIEDTIFSCDRGFFWAREEPELLNGSIGKIINVLKDDGGEVFDSKEFKKMVKHAVELKNEIRKFEKNETMIMDELETSYDELMVMVGHLFDFEAIQKLLSAKNLISALSLYFQGLFNNISLDEEVKIDVKHIFLLKKNALVRVSKTSLDGKFQKPKLKKEVTKDEKFDKFEISEIKEK